MCFSEKFLRVLLVSQAIVIERPINNGLGSRRSSLLVPSPLFISLVGETSVLSVHYVLLALKREEAGRGEDGWAPKLTWT